MKIKLAHLFEKIDKEFLIKITPCVLICYFSLLLFPYIFAPIPSIYSFFLKTYINLPLRLLATILVIIFSVFIFVRFKPKIDKKYLFFSFVLIAIMIISLFTSPKEFKSIITHDPYAYETLVMYKIGIIDILSGFASCFVDIVFGFLFVFILPSCITKDTLKPLLLFIFLFIIFECLYSITFEFRKYVVTFSAGDSAYGGYDIDISGTFASKNQFGSFLVMGFIAGFFSLKWYFIQNRKIKPIIIFGLVVIGGITVFSLCKTAIISLLLFMIPFIFLWFKNLIKYKKIVKIIIATLILFFIIIFVILVMSTSLGDSGFLNKIQKGIKLLFIDSFSTAKESRYMAWILSFSTLFNHHLVVGYPKGTLQYLLRVETNGYAIYPHNGFIQQALCYGLFGLFVLFYLYITILKRISKISNKASKRMWISLLLSAFVFMMTETEVILMSGSLLTFGYSILLSSIPVLNKPEHSVNYYEIEL